MEKTFLEKNLERVFEYNLNLAASIKDQAELKGEFDFKKAKSGDIILSHNGIIIHDEIDPINEAVEVFEKHIHQNKPENIFILFGLDLGYLFKRFSMSGKSKIIVFEPDLKILRLTLESVDFSNELNSENTMIAQTIPDLTKAIECLYEPGSEVIVTAIDYYKKLYSNIIGQLEAEIQSVIPVPYKGGPLKVNIGAGRWQKDDWKTLDWYLFANFNIDLRNNENLPIKDGLIEKAFSSHCIEHIEDSHLDHLLSELFRCMKPGGILRLSCPDADLAFEAYKRKDLDWFKWVVPKNLGAMLVNVFVSYELGGPEVKDEEVEEKFNSLDKDEFIQWCVGLADRTRPYIAHTNGFTYNKLQKMLSYRGFSDISNSAYRQSKDAELRDSEFDLHPNISLYVECYKPF